LSERGLWNRIADYYGEEYSLFDCLPEEAKQNVKEKNLVDGTCKALCRLILCPGFQNPSDLRDAIQMATYYRYLKHNVDRPLVSSSRTLELINQDYTQGEEKKQFRVYIQSEVESTGSLYQDVIGITVTDLQTVIKAWNKWATGKKPLWETVERYGGRPTPTRRSMNDAWEKKQEWMMQEDFLDEEGERPEVDEHQADANEADQNQAVENQVIDLTGSAGDNDNLAGREAENQRIGVP
jgi:hypothetical protein